MKCPILLATSSFTVLLDMLHCRFLAPIELQADFAGESLKVGWVLDQLVLNNFLLELLLLKANPGKVLTGILNVHHTDIPGYGNDEYPVLVRAEMCVPVFIIIREVALTDWTPLKTFLRIDLGWNMGLEVGAKGGSSRCNTLMRNPRFKLDTCRHFS